MTHLQDSSAWWHGLVQQGVEVLPVIFKMYPSIVSSVGGEHEAGLQQAPGWLRQGAEVLGLQGLRRLNGRGAQEKNIMLGM